MRMNAVDKDVGKLIDLVSLQVDFISSLLPMCSLFKLKLFFKVENLGIAALHKRVIVPFEVSDEFSLALSSRHKVLYILLKNGGFLCLVNASRADHLCWVIKTLESVAGLRRISLHSDLGMTRVQVSFADFFRDRFHSVLTNLTHSTHLCAFIDGICLGNRSHILLLALDWLGL